MSIKWKFLRGQEGMGPTPAMFKAILFGMLQSIACQEKALWTESGIMARARRHCATRRPQMKRLDRRAIVGDHVFWSVAIVEID